MDGNFIQLRVVYADLPDLIELSVSVAHAGWAARCTGYALPTAFADEARRLLEWASSPAGTQQIEAGADTGIGWMVLQFYTIDLAGHARCAVTLSIDYHEPDSCREKMWRFAIEVPTELGSVQRFAEVCIAMSSDFSQEARLNVLPQ